MTRSGKKCGAPKTPLNLPALKRTRRAATPNPNTVTSEASLPEIPHTPVTDKSQAARASKRTFPATPEQLPAAKRIRRAVTFAPQVPSVEELGDAMPRTPSAIMSSDAQPALRRSPRFRRAVVDVQQSVAAEVSVPEVSRALAIVESPAAQPAVRLSSHARLARAVTPQADDDEHFPAVIPQTLVADQSLAAQPALRRSPRIRLIVRRPNLVCIMPHQVQGYRARRLALDRPDVADAQELWDEIQAGLPPKKIAGSPVGSRIAEQIAPQAVPAQAAPAVIAHAPMAVQPAASAGHDTVNTVPAGYRFHPGQPVGPARLGEHDVGKLVYFIIRNRNGKGFIKRFVDLDMSFDDPVMIRRLSAWRHAVVRTNPETKVRDGKDDYLVSSFSFHSLCFRNDIY